MSACWIAVASAAHVRIGRQGGFMQVNHGKAAPLERMRVGDGFAYYSPRAAYPDGEVMQAFTALGRVTGEAIFQADVGGAPRPFRRQVAFAPVRSAPIKPLIASLSFIRSKTHWGAAFRFGVVRIEAADFARIAAALGRDFAADFPDLERPEKAAAA